MQLVQNLSKKELQCKSTVFEDSIFAIALFGTLLLLFIFAGVPYWITQTTIPLWANVALFVFFEAIAITLLITLFREGSFHYAANDSGWYFRPTSSRKHFVLVPWSSCVAVQKSSLNASDGIQIEVKNSAENLIFSPRHGKRTTSNGNVAFVLLSVRESRVPKHVEIFRKLKYKSDVRLLVPSTGDQSS